MVHRRQVVTAVTLAVGALLLALSLRIEPGSTWFYPATVALALVWSVGAVASGPLHAGRVPHWRRTGDPIRPVLAPILVGLALAGIFTVGGLVVREIGWLDEQVRSVLDFADRGSVPVLVLVTAINGVGEELFFRGAVFAAAPRRPLLWSTLLYVIATAATGNVMLTFAAVLLGVVVGLQRRVSGGVLAPILTHCTWSLTMLLVLPLLFG